jgi:Uma2 family endonuclease
MSSVQKILPHYTYDDWVHWEGSWELIDGFPIAMSPTPVPKHQQVAAALRAEFYHELKKCRKCTVYDPLDYVIAKDTILVPDILIVYKKIEKKYLDFPPALVAEILSPSTALRDKHTKYQLYEQQGVKYYLIVDSDKSTIEIFELVKGKYMLQTLGKGEVFDFSFEKDCSARISFNEILQ